MPRPHRVSWGRSMTTRRTSAKHVQRGRTRMNRVKRTFSRPAAPAAPAAVPCHSPRPFDRPTPGRARPVPTVPMRSQLKDGTRARALYGRTSSAAITWTPCSASRAWWAMASATARTTTKNGKEHRNHRDVALHNALLTPRVL
eukprot:scaffold664_cov260-Pinguiococcus_pyrenoidosus.AAC.8